MSDEKNSSNFLIKSIKKNGVLYLVSTACSKLIALFLLPYITSKLSQEDFGLFGLSQSLLPLTTIGISFYMDLAVYRLYHDLKVNTEKKILISSVINFTLIWGVVASGLMYFPLEFGMGQLIQTDISAIALLSGLILTLAVSIQLNTVIEIFWAQEKRFKLVNSTRILKSVIYASSVFLSLNFLAANVEVLIGSLIISQLFIIFGNIFILSRENYYYLKIDFRVISRCLIYAVPAMPQLIFSWFNGFIDRIFITQFVGLKELAIFSLGATFAGIISIVSTAYAQVFNSVAIEATIDSAKEKSYNLINKVFNHFYSLLILLYLTISIFSYEFIHIIFDDRYYGAHIFIQIIGIQFLIGAYYKSQILVLHSLKKIKIISLSSLLAASTNVVLNYIFIPRYGAIAAAVTTVISALIYMLTLNIYCYRISGFKNSSKILWTGVLPALITILLIGTVFKDFFIQDFFRAIVIKLIILSLLFLNVIRNFR